MNIADCYRLLGLTSKASQAEVKASFRRLARLYHPDVNTGDRYAHEKFIRLHEAYKLLLEVATPEPEPVRQPQTTPAAKKEPVVTVRRQPAATRVTAKEPKFQENCQLTDFERRMKENSYIQLQYLLKSQRFPRAIALVEGLAQRLPYDTEVRQWQAIAYQRWGRHLIGEKQLDKARVYLKKALRTDPHNRSLWSEVERDFRRLEKVF